MYRYDFCTIWRGGWVNVNDGGGRGRTPDNYVDPARGWWHGAWCWYAKSTGLYPIIDGFGILNTIEREISGLIANGQFIYLFIYLHK